MAKIILFQRRCNHFDRVVPDLSSVMLDPPGLRVYLLVLFLRDRNNRTSPIEDYETAAGRALINRTNVPSHYG